jgi:hypothetical protein
MMDWNRRSFADLKKRMLVSKYNNLQGLSAIKAGTYQSKEGPGRCGTVSAPLYRGM